MSNGGVQLQFANGVFNATSQSGTSSGTVAGTLKNNALSVAVALQGVNLTFGNDAHHLETMTVSLQSAEASHKNVSASVSVTVDDAHQHYMTGSVTAVFLALTAVL